MIKFDTVMSNIIDKIKTYLRDNGYTKTLLIYNNLGVATNDYKEENSDTIVTKQYGIYRNQTSQISTVSDALNMLTATAVIDLRVDAIPEEDGTYPEVDKIVGLLNDCAAQITGQYTSITEGGVSYAILPVMSPATVGTYQKDSSNWGAYVPVSVQIAFTALEGALAPTAVKLEIDGKQIPLTELVVSRTKTATTDVGASSVNGATANSDDSTTLEVQFASPASDGKTDGILQELMVASTNQLHCVVLGGVTSKIPKRCYLMELAKIQLTRRNNETVGINGNLLELDPNAVTEYGSAWKTVTLSTNGGSDSKSITPGAGEWCFFWGDGTSSGPVTKAAGEAVTKYYKDAGSYKVFYCNLAAMR